MADKGSNQPSCSQNGSLFLRSVRDRRHVNCPKGFKKNKWRKISKCPELPTIMENEILTNFQMTCFRIASMCRKRAIKERNKANKRSSK